MFRLYIIHFEKPYYHAKHYIGITGQSLQTRLKKHRKRDGSCLTRAVVKADIKLQSIHLLGEFFNADLARQAEIKLKNRKESAKFCPRCKEQYREDRNEKQRQRRRLKNE